MLVHLDVLIGLAAVMLGFSLLITVISQALSTLLAVRGKNLKWGISVLIQQLHADKFAPPKTKVPVFGNDLNEVVTTAVDKVLKHPLLSDSKLPVGYWKLASAVRFD